MQHSHTYRPEYAQDSGQGAETVPSMMAVQLSGQLRQGSRRAHGGQMPRTGGRGGQGAASDGHRRGREAADALTLATVAA